MFLNSNYPAACTPAGTTGACRRDVNGSSGAIRRDDGSTGAVRDDEDVVLPPKRNLVPAGRRHFRRGAHAAHPDRSTAASVLGRRRRRRGAGEPAVAVALARRAGRGRQALCQRAPARDASPAHFDARLPPIGLRAGRQSTGARLSPARVSRSALENAALDFRDRRSLRAFQSDFSFFRTIIRRFFFFCFQRAL